MIARLKQWFRGSTDQAEQPASRTARHTPKRPSNAWWQQPIEQVTAWWRQGLAWLANRKDTTVSEPAVTSDGPLPRSGEPDQMSRATYRLTGKGRYDYDPHTNQLTDLGKTQRLTHRLNLAIIVLVTLIVLVLAIMIFV